MFVKAGEEGWKCFIPIYNIYTLCTIIGVSPYWLLFVFIASFLNAIPVFGNIISIGSTLYFGVLIAVSTAKSFGKSDSYAIGLFLFPPLFNFILGVGSSNYVGPTPMNDPVGDWILGIFGKENTTSYHKNPNESETRNENGYSYTYSNHSETSKSDIEEVEVLEEKTIHFCPNCGTNIEPGENFCVSCGTKIN